MCENSLRFRRELGPIIYIFTAKVFPLETRKEKTLNLETKRHNSVEMVTLSLTYTIYGRNVVRYAGERN